MEQWEKDYIHEMACDKAAKKAATERMVREYSAAMAYAEGTTCCSFHRDKLKWEAEMAFWNRQNAIYDGDY